VLVLISSMGFYVDHMICGMSGEHKLAINASIDSCSDVCDSGEDEGVSKSCCDYDSNYFQEDLRVNPSQKTSKQQFSSFKYIPLAEVFTELNCAESFCFHQLETPAALPSVKRHILHETYLI
jgi:hypothetical protein